MAVFSKSSVQNLENLKCAVILHPWNKSCVHGNWEWMAGSLKGVFIFFTIMHGIQYLFMLRNKKKIQVSQMFSKLMRSMVFGISYSTLIIPMNCLSQKILGKFNNTIFYYVIPFVCGLPIFFETPERRKITVTTFISMFLECIYKVLVNRKIISRSTKFETLLFMFVNAFLMYSLRMRQEFSDKKDTTIWIFSPASPKKDDSEKNISQNNEKRCLHEYSCRENIIRITLKYSLIGLAMAIVRFIIHKVMSPTKNNESFFQWRSLQLSSFISSYVFIFEAVNCYLCKLDGKHDAIHTFWSGLLAGSSYWLSPNPQIMFTAATILLKIIGDNMMEKYSLPNLPYSEFTFVFSNMYLLQRLVTDFPSVPKFFYNILQVASRKKAGIMIKAANQALCN